MRALVTGAGGQIGREVVELFEVAGHEVVAATREELDVTDRDAVLSACFTFEPDVTVHTATWTAVDACEGDPVKAFTVNALGTRHVAEGVRRTGGHLVAISSDYVFDGKSNRPYLEWDVPNPQSVYGRSLLAREVEAGPGATVVRTSWVSGRYGSNFVKTMLRLANASSDSVTVVDDQHGCPTFVSDLAPVLVRLAVDRRPGIFHVTNQGSTTWWGLAREIFALAGHDESRVVPVATGDLDPPRAATRPRSSILEGVALAAARLPRPGDFHPPLAALVKELSA